MNRVKYRIIGAVAGLLVALFSTFVLARCQREKTFYKDGMTITLTSKFKEYESDSFPIYYERNDASVGALKTSFEELGTSTYTTEEFAWELISRGDYKSYTKNEGNYVSFTFKASANGKEYYSYCACYKTNDAYWVVRFTCQSKNESKLQEDFEKWASSVVFD